MSSLPSRLCTFADFRARWYRDYILAADELFALHRKPWEDAAIFEALQSRGMLNYGRRGVGFGVGRERLPAVFAARGVEVLATDQAPSEVAERDWGKTGQLAYGLDDLRHESVCPPKEFAKRVTFQHADMCDLSALPRAAFDFCWSACALDHLGTLAEGLRFVRESLELLRPGGVAVHTTEFNVASEDRTIESGPVVFYRKHDLQAFAEQVRAARFRMAPIDFRTGDTAPDRYVDAEPHRQDCHLKLEAGGFVVTSVVLIIERP